MRPNKFESGGVEPLGEDELREAIKEISDGQTKEDATRYLERLLALLEEEKKEREANLMDADSF